MSYLQQIETLIAAYAQNHSTTDFLVEAKGDYWTEPPSNTDESIFRMTNELNVFVAKVLVFTRHDEIPLDYVPEQNKQWVIRDRELFLKRMLSELIQEGF